MFVPQVTFASQPEVEERCLDVMASPLEVVRIYSPVRCYVKYAVALVVFVAVAVQLRSMMLHCCCLRLVLVVVVEMVVVD